LALACALAFLRCHAAAPAIAATGATFAPAQFDLRAIREPSTLRAEESAPRAQSGVRLADVKFSSLAWDEHGVVQKIRIHALLAVPEPMTGVRPAVVSAHGLGARAEPEEAIEIARGLDVVALAIDAPGCGSSEGDGPTAEDPGPIFRGAHDIRASWLYQYAYAAMRAVPYLRARADSDPHTT